MCDQDDINRQSDYVYGSQMAQARTAEAKWREQQAEAAELRMHNASEGVRKAMLLDQIQAMQDHCLGQQLHDEVHAWEQSEAQRLEAQLVRKGMPPQIKTQEAQLAAVMSQEAPDVTRDDIAAVGKIVRSASVNALPQGEAFMRTTVLDFAAHCAKYAVWRDREHRRGDGWVLREDVKAIVRDIVRDALSGEDVPADAVMPILARVMTRIDAWAAKK